MRSYIVGGYGKLQQVKLLSFPVLPFPMVLPPGRVPKTALGKGRPSSGNPTEMLSSLLLWYDLVSQADIVVDIITGKGGGE